MITCEGEDTKEAPQVTTWLQPNLSDHAGGIETDVNSILSSSMNERWNPEQLSPYSMQDEGIDCMLPFSICPEENGISSWLNEEEDEGKGKGLVLSSRDDKPIDLRSLIVEVKDFSPDWDFTEGGAKLLLIFEGTLGDEVQQYWCLFDRVEVPAEIIQPGTSNFMMMSITLR